MIRALVTHIETADAEIIWQRASAQIETPPELHADVSKATDLHAEVSTASELQASDINYGVLQAASIHYQWASAADVWPDHQPLNQLPKDSLFLSELLAVVVRKEVGDVTALSDASKLSLEKQAQDLSVLTDWVGREVTKASQQEGIPLDDRRVLGIHKRGVDEYSLADSAQFTFTKSGADDVSFADELSMRTHFNRQFEDAFTLDDWTKIGKDFTGAKGNVLGVQDVLSHEYLKSLSEILSAVDAQQWEIIKPHSETVSTSDQFAWGYSAAKTETLTTTDYARWVYEKPSQEHLLLADAVAWIYRAPYSETLSTKDHSWLELDKRIDDGFHLDDALALDDDLSASKINRLQFSDHHSHQLTKAQEDVAPLLDQTAKSLSSRKQNLIGVIDSSAFSLHKSFKETLLLQDKVNRDGIEGIEEVTSFGLEDQHHAVVAKHLSEGVPVWDESSYQLTQSPRIESIGVVDTPAIHYRFNLVDGFELTDSFGVQKNYIGDLDHFIGAGAINEMVVNGGGLNGTAWPLFERSTEDRVGFSEDFSYQFISGGLLNGSAINACSVN